MLADPSMHDMSFHADASGNVMAKEVWAFDFDGVVCDSVGESSLSAWKAAAELWPQVLMTPGVSFFGWDLLTPDCCNG